jgi:hypothetical protein
MSQVWQWTWGAVAFGSELAALAALAVGGWALPVPTALRLAAAIGLPVVAAVLWGLFAAPHAVLAVPALALVVKVAVLGGAVLALLLTAHPALAGTLAAAAVLGTMLSPAPEALLTAAAR